MLRNVNPMLFQFVCFFALLPHVSAVSFTVTLKRTDKEKLVKNLEYAVDEKADHFSNVYVGHLTIGDPPQELALEFSTITDKTWVPAAQNNHYEWAESRQRYTFDETLSRSAQIETQHFASRDANGYYLEEYIGFGDGKNRVRIPTAVSIGLGTVILGSPLGTFGLGPPHLQHKPANARKPISGRVSGTGGSAGVRSDRPASEFGIRPKLTTDIAGRPPQISESSAKSAAAKAKANAQRLALRAKEIALKAQKLVSELNTATRDLGKLDKRAASDHHFRRRRHSYYFHKQRRHREAKWPDPDAPDRDFETSSEKMIDDLLAPDPTDPPADPEPTTQPSSDVEIQVDEFVNIEDNPSSWEARPEPEKEKRKEKPTIINKSRQAARTRPIFPHHKVKITEAVVNIDDPETPNGGDAEIEIHEDTEKSAERSNPHKPHQKKFVTDAATGITAMAPSVIAGIMESNVLSRPIITLLLNRCRPAKSAATGTGEKMDEVMAERAVGECFDGGLAAFGRELRDRCEAVEAWAPVPSIVADSRWTMVLDRVAMGKAVYNQKVTAVIALNTNKILMPRAVLRRFAKALDIWETGWGGEERLDEMHVRCDKELHLDIRVQGRDFRIRDEFIKTPDDETMCLISVGATPHDENYWVLGQPFSRAFCVVLDYGERRIGVANRLPPK